MYWYQERKITKPHAMDCSKPAMPLSSVPHRAYSHITLILSSKWPRSWCKHVKVCSCHLELLETHCYSAILNLRVKVYCRASNLTFGGLWKNKSCSFLRVNGLLNQLPKSSQLGVCSKRQPTHCLVTRCLRQETWQDVSNLIRR